MRYYLKQDGRIDGPWPADEIRNLIAKNEWALRAEATEERGQTLSQLKTSTAWVPVGTALGGEVIMQPAPTSARRTSVREMVPRICGFVGAAALYLLALFSPGGSQGVGALKAFQLALVGSLIGYGIGYLINAVGGAIGRLRQKPNAKGSDVTPTTSAGA